jgi:hypothetical protein
MDELRKAVIDNTSALRGEDKDIANTFVDVFGSLKTQNSNFETNIQNVKDYAAALTNYNSLATEVDVLTGEKKSEEDSIISDRGAFAWDAVLTFLTLGALTSNPV